MRIRRRVRAPGRYAAVLAAVLAGATAWPAVALAGKGPAFRYIYVGHFGSSSGSDALARPDGIAVDQICGDVYVSDFAAHRLIRFDQNGSVLGTIGRPGTGEGGLVAPVGLFVSPAYLPPPNPQGPPQPCGSIGTVSTMIWVADQGANRVTLFSPSGHWEGGLCYWPASMQPDGCSLREGNALDFYPEDVWVTENAFYVAGGLQRRVSEYGRISGALLRTTTSGPAGASVAVWGNELWSVRFDQPVLGLFSLDPANPAIDLEHVFGSTFDPHTPGSFARPYAVATSPNGLVFVDDGYRVQVFSPSGRYLSAITLRGADTAVPGEDVAVRYDGTVYIARGSLHRVDVYSPGVLVSLRLKALPNATFLPVGHEPDSASAGRFPIEFTGTVLPKRPHQKIEIQEVGAGFKTVVVTRLDRASRFRVVWHAPWRHRTYYFRAFFRDPHPYYADRASAIEQIRIN